MLKSHQSKYFYLWFLSHSLTIYQKSESHEAPRKMRKYSWEVFAIKQGLLIKFHFSISLNPAVNPVDQTLPSSAGVYPENNRHNCSLPLWVLALTPATAWFMLSSGFHTQPLETRSRQPNYPTHPKLERLCNSSLKGSHQPAYVSQTASWEQHWLPLCPCIP